MITIDSLLEWECRPIDDNWTLLHAQIESASSFSIVVPMSLEPLAFAALIFKIDSVFWSMYQVHGACVVQ